MLNKKPLATAGVVALAFCVLTSAGCWRRKGAEAPSATPQNLLLITIDGLSAERMGCYNAQVRRTPTPVLDGLALAGVLAEHARATSMLSLPAHASLLSGLASAPLDGSAQTLALLLQAKGFRTAAVVASPALGTAAGLNRGFEIFDANLPPASRSDGLLLGDPQYRPARDATAVTRAAGDLLVSALTSAKQAKGGARPAWFLWINYADALPPYRVLNKKLADFFPDERDAAIASIDEELGKLFQVLEMADAKRDTLVVVAGGAPAPSFGSEAAAFRVPLLLARKGTLPAGRRVKTALSLCDLPATLASLLHVKPAPAWRPEQDLSAALLSGAEPQERATPFENPLPAHVFGTPAVPTAQDAQAYLALSAALQKGAPLTPALAATARRLATAFPASELLTGWAGVAALSGGAAAEAETAFTGALRLRPDSIAWRNNLALTLCAQGQMPKGLDMLNNLHEAYPDNLEVRNNLIRMLTFAGEKLLAARVPGDALACFQRVAQLAPKAAPAYAACGRAHEAMGQREDALSAYRKSLELDPQQLAVRKAVQALEPKAKE